ncbi:unnamed protein product [Gongylonema pulchrum]|uniref:Glucuronosyltransferase n=1 Tax=Gongylonema pulchrum TaxID=637853 RepID=A0A183ESN9_9BILA|nr:unnamed protein product [Gongylonema pulchrum]
MVLSLKILMFSPAIGHSHLQFVGKLADILVLGGHYVHVIISEWDPALTSNGTKYAQRVTRLKSSKPSQYAKMRFRVDPFADPLLNESSIFISVANQFCEGI